MTGVRSIVVWFIGASIITGLAGCASENPQPTGSAAVTEVSAPGAVLAEAVPIGLNLQVDPPTGANRTLKITVSLDKPLDVKKGDIYYLAYDVRYEQPVSGDVHADPEQYLSLSDSARKIVAQRDGDSVVTEVPIIGKSAGSANMVVYVTVWTVNANTQPRGATKSEKITY